MSSDTSGSSDELDYSPKQKIAKKASNEDSKVDSESSWKNTSKKTNSAHNFGKRYMLQHGHKEGRGLGKCQDGIVEPVQASLQKGTRGLGFKPKDLENVVSNYDSSLEKISIDEEVIWLENEYKDGLSEEELRSWIKTGKPLERVPDNSYFCDSKIVKEIFRLKNVFSSITRKELKSGQLRSNPFECISKGIFLNRAAMKMANMDAILDRMFTEPKDLSGEPILGSNDLLYFADVCAGPGGFSEYVLYRKKWRAKGFGFTLKSENDFLLDEFWAGPPETFETHYGARNDGDVLVPENIESFKNHVLKNTDGKGVHFMMADGGVDFTDRFNEQELVAKKLYLCQCLVALLIVRTGGHFVVKLFDLFTPFSAGIVYLMHRSFKSISIIKPNTSRPANSERYLVCKYKREDSKSIANHLEKINRIIPLYGEKDKTDILELIPIEFLKKEKFFSYLVDSNVRIGNNQIIYLIKMATFAENSDFKDEKQQTLRKECLKKWDIPDEARAEPKKYNAKEMCSELMSSSSFKIESELKQQNFQAEEDFSFRLFKSKIDCIHDWYYVVLNRENTCGFYLSLGRSNIYKYMEGKNGKKWENWNKDVHGCAGLSLPAGTIVYGELVPELRGENRSQYKNYAFHIIDGLFLGGENIQNFGIQERWRRCELFAKALYKDSFPVRMKSHYPLSEINLLKNTLVMRKIKSSAVECACITVEDRFWKAGGIIFFRVTKGSYHLAFSNTHQKRYVYNSESKNSFFEDSIGEKEKAEIYADFKNSFAKKEVWLWKSPRDVFETEFEKNDRG